MHKSSFRKMRKFLLEYSQHFNSSPNRVLDFGSYDVNGSYRSLFTKSWHYTGIDLQDGPNVDLVPTNPYKWAEINNEECDLFISGQALEHCEYFWLVFEEIYRVLKPNGIACIIVPSSGPEHKHPVDCWRFFPDGMKAVCKYSGLKVIKAETDWSPDVESDGGHIWKDTLFIASKP